MVLRKVLLIIWIIFGPPLIMAENYSDSDSEEFIGFTQADLGDENNDFIPDSEPDSDLSISTLHSSDISNIKRKYIYIYPTLSDPPVMSILLLQGHIIYRILHLPQLCE